MADDGEERAGHIARLLIAAGAAVTAAFAGSWLFGPGGTLVATGVCAAISGAAAELYGAVVKRAKRQVKTGLPAVQIPKPPPRLVMRAGGAALAVAALAFFAVTAIEAASGRTLHAITTGSAQRGTSLGDVVSSPPPATVPATPGPSAPTSAPTASQQQPGTVVTSAQPATPETGSTPASTQPAPDVTASQADTPQPPSAAPSAADTPVPVPGDSGPPSSPDTPPAPG